MGYKGRRGASWGVFLVLCGSISACGHGGYYQVRPGDTLSAIGQRYGIPYQEIARLNNLRDPDRIEVGQRLRIPRAAARSSSTPPPSRQLAAILPSSPRTRPDALPLDERPRGQGGLLSWPVEGTVTSGFGPRNGSFHDGIDIAAPVGTPVVAAADGEVIFSDELRGYGKVVIIRHDAQYVTVYAHNRVNWVREGQFVRRGQRIAEVGQSGRTSGPSLHFEVRKNNLAQDPLRYLPYDRRTVRESRAP